MNNESLLKTYVKLNILIAIVLLILIFVYHNHYTGDFFLEVDKGVFHVILDGYFEDTEIFNTPFIAFLVITIFHTVVWLFVGRNVNSEKQQLNEAPIINLLLSVVLVLGQFLFIWMIPSTISGTVRDLVIFTEFPQSGGDLVRAINITYFITFVYLVYNIVIVTLIREPVEKDTVDHVLEEENLLREFLKD